MLLGDVGGLSGLLYIIGATIVSFLSIYNAENYVASNLYKTRKKSDKTENSESYEDMDPWKQYAVIEYLQDRLPKCCIIGCLRRKKRCEDFFEARERLLEEMDLIKHI